MLLIFAIIITVFAVLTEVFGEARDYGALRFVVMRVAAMAVTAGGRFVGFVLLTVRMRRSRVFRNGSVHFCILVLRSF